jgi:hypothetical protein
VKSQSKGAASSKTTRGVTGVAGGAKPFKEEEVKFQRVIG